MIAAGSGAWVWGVLGIAMGDGRTVALWLTSYPGYLVPSAMWGLHRWLRSDGIVVPIRQLVVASVLKL